MIDSGRSRAVVDERAAWSGELVVERDRGGEAQQPLQDSLSESRERSCAVALERQGSLAGPEDRLDPLAQRCQMRTPARLVLATRSEDRGVKLADGLRELPPGIALIADQRLTACPARAAEQL